MLRTEFLRGGWLFVVQKGGEEEGGEKVEEERGGEVVRVRQSERAQREGAEG